MVEAEGTPPPNDFRMESVVPTKDDLLFDGEPYLRKNIVKGPYDNVEHYLDVHFRLLREDSLRVLRDGVRQYHQLGHKPRKKAAELIVYKNVRMGQPVTVVEGDLVSDAKFPARICHSAKQLMCGSLVVLSSDNFTKNFLFATVYYPPFRLDRDAGYVTLEFLTDQGPVDYNLQYQMMESPAFFEAYRHILRGLQSFARGEDIPLSKYLIKLNTSPGLPSYFQEARSFGMDFSILSGERQSRIVDVRQAHKIVSPEDIGLDRSQHTALMMVLRQELAVIQGPPGTGKTYLGHQICRLLLANQHLWNSDQQHPMLVVCNSDHTLDQFLAGVLNNMIRDTGHTEPYNTQRHIVRVGTKCHNPDLKPYMLSEIRRAHRRRFPQPLGLQRREIYQRRQDMAQGFTEHYRTFKALYKEILPAEQFTPGVGGPMSESHRQQLGHYIIVTNMRYLRSLDDVFVDWLTRRSRPKHLVEEDYGQTAERDRPTERQVHLKPFVKRILAALPYSEENAESVRDIWALPLGERWRLYKYWVSKLADASQKKLSDCELQLRRITDEIRDLNQMADVELLKSARVLGMTTTDAARLQPVLKAIQCPIIIIEEAAKVLEARVLTTLTVNSKHVILIGDHKQMRPEPAVQDLATKYHLDVSLFERLINNEFPYVMLQNQHRMRKEIARGIMPHFYHNLRDDPSVLQYKPIDGMAKNFAFINHNYPEKTDLEQKILINEYEAQFALRLAHYLLQQGYQPNQVTILSANVGQLRFLRQQADAKLGRRHRVRIDTVDNYEGEESDIIILSLVRSLSPDGNLGLLSIDNRVCLAMSRAKKGFYILGNIDFLASKCTLWSKIKRSLKECDSLSNSLTVACQSHGNEQVISTWRDFDRLTSRGGCHLFCDHRLDCGHACPRLCHPPKHDNVKCAEPCGRTCSNGHPCNKKCYERCGKCLVNVVATLPCGHSTMKPCHADPSSIMCDRSVLKKLQCGHMSLQKCSTPSSCERPVEKTLPCGHRTLVPCKQDPSVFKCPTKVKKQWPGCKHEVEMECWIDPQQGECPFPCGMILPDCEHLCKGTCGGCRRGRLHSRCEERCKRLLFCGHLCTGYCSSVCPPCEKPCETECFHSRCAVPSNRSTKKKSRKCGDLCSPCVQDCANICEHRSCSQKCMKPCDVDPCEERCSKNLYCGHRCMGLCGEDCPLVCRDCPRGQLKKAYEAASEMFLGFEAEDDALFIQLGCGHCIELRGMDRWIQELIDGSSAIVQICCPKCRAPVRKSRRYQKQLNQRMNDMEQIKKSLIGGRLDRLDGMRQDIMESVKTELDVAGTMSRTYPIFSEFCHVAMALRSLMSEAVFVTKELVDNFSSWERFLDQLLAVIRAIEQQPFTHCQHDNVREAVLTFFGMENVSECLKREWMTLLHFLENDLAKPTASALMYNEFGYELNRLDRAFQVMDTLYMCDETGMLPPDTLSVLSELNKLLNFSTKSNADSLDEFNRLLKLISREVRVLYKEREEIRRGLGRAVTSWYKCPNGHLYGIGDCGRADVVGTCPDCGAEIGGTRHVIREGNMLDRRMTIEHRRTTGLPLDEEANPFQVIF